MDALIDTRNKMKLPGTALDLPHAKAGEQDDEQQCKGEQRAALRRAAAQGRPPFPPVDIGIMFVLR